MGIKLLTYNLWFAAPDTDDSGGFIRYLNRPEHIRAVSTFRMSAHCLNIESMRWGRGAQHVQRNNRLCKCCDNQVREDEAHVFECPAYADLRAEYADILPIGIPVQEIDIWMRTYMNHGNNAHSWRRLADLLIKIMAVRESIVAPPVG